jgi:type I restriction enzyme S subunit
MARSSLYPPSVDPGFPVLPPTPAGWIRKTFGDVVVPIERPVTLEPTASYQLVTAKRNRGGIVSRGKLLGHEILTKTQFRTHAGDFLISRRQIIHGACGIVPLDLHGAIVSNEYSALLARSELLLEFLAHYCHAPYFQRTCFHSSHGVDVEKMIFKLEEWLARDVDLPPLSEQRAVAAIISSVDDAIAAAQEVVDQLQVVKRAMMAQLFVQGVPGRHSKFKETEIGEVPEAWEVVPVGSAGAVDAGKAKDPRSSGVMRPYLRVANVFDGEIRAQDVMEMGFSDEEFLRFALREGDVLLNEGQSVDLVGRCSMYRGEVGRPCAIQNALLRFRATGMVEASFAEQFFRWCQHSGRFAEIATQTTSIAHLGLKRFASMLMPVPPKQEQLAISVMLGRVDERLAVEREAVLSLAALKSALLSALLSGEVRVHPDGDVAR